MKILVTNDDGVSAAGIHALARAARHLGDVVIVAPDRERSACGHSLTMRDPLRVKKMAVEGFEAYAVNGVPTDCVNVGRDMFGIDLVLSGINHGPNLGIDVTYSGTVAGAIEGALNGIRSISVSLALFVEDAPMHLDTAEGWLRENLDWLIKLDVPASTLLNINVPSTLPENLKGHRFAKMGERVYEDRIERREDPWGRVYYWQGGVASMIDGQPHTDVEAIREGYVSITPVTTDWTDWSALSLLERQSSKV
jgi:5'-nucleotidase